MPRIRKSLRGREPRYVTLAESDLEIQSIVELNSTMQIESHLVDISQSGAKLIVPEPLGRHAMFSLHVRVDAIDFQVRQVGKVYWHALTTNQKWCIGCRFEDKIRQADLELLCEKGCVERRRDVRFEMSEMISIRRQLQTERLAARLINVSRSGFCIKASGDYEPGERLLVELDSDSESESQAQIVTRVVWSCADGSHTTIGCQFEHHAGYELLTRGLDADR